MRALLLCCLLVWMALRSTMAATAAPADSALPATGLLQVLVALGLVLAAIAAFAWMLRRLTPGAIGTHGWLRVVGGAMVGPKERVVLVEIGDTWLVLGVAAGSVNLLHTLPKPPVIESQAAEPGAARFSNALLHALARRRKN